MSESEKDPRLNAFSHFLVAHAKLSDRIAGDLERAGGVPLDVYDVLVTLEEQPGQRMRLNELANEIVLSKSGLTRRLQRLERLGYIRREVCPSDRRGAFAVLTPEGLKAREEAWPRFREAIQGYFGEKMTEGEARQMTAVMRRVIEGLDKGALDRVCGASLDS